MKKLTLNSLRSIPAALVLLFCLLANQAKAGLTTWDPQALNTQSPYSTLHLDGTWEGNNWSTSQNGQAAPGAWVEGNAAVFAVNTGTGTPAFTVTMNANHTVGGMFSGPLTWNPAQVTFTGSGIMTLGPNNANGFDVNSNTGNPGQLAINNVVAGGAGAFFYAEGSGQIYLNGVNTYTAGTWLGYSGTTFTGILNFNNAASFGTGSIVISNTTTLIAALVAEGSSAITIPNAVTNAGAPLPQLNIVGVPAANGGVTFSGRWDLLGNARIGSGVVGNLVTISGVMAGSGSFQAFNPGILALSGVNTFTGNLTNAMTGTLTVNSISDGGTSAIGPSATAKLTLAGATFQYTGAGAATTARPTWLTAASTLNLPNGNLTLNGAFKSSNGANKLTKTSGGTLTLGGTVDNSSLALAVNGGTVILNKTSTSTVHGIGGATSVGSGS